MPKRKLEIMRNEDHASAPSTPNNGECSRKVNDDNGRDYDRIQQPGHSISGETESTNLDLVSLNQDHEDTPDRETSVIREELQLGNSYEVDEGDSMTVEEECQVPQGTVTGILATMPVAKPVECYNMQHKNRGTCLVLNHEVVCGTSSKREGTEFDVKRIYDTFTKLRFNVVICPNLTHCGILEEIKKLSDPNETEHSDSDCLCIFVLTHGLPNDFLLAADAAYISNELWKPFTADKCPTLAGKPKLFFIQACRGDVMDRSITMEDHYNHTETDSLITSYTIPADSDFLIGHSCPDGFQSVRNTEKGSWYIQCLCEVLDAYAATTGLMKMLTITARRVSTDCEWYRKENSQLVIRKQVPSTVSTLTKDVYFSTT